MPQTPGVPGPRPAPRTTAVPARLPGPSADRPGPTAHSRSTAHSRTDELLDFLRARLDADGLAVLAGHEPRCFPLGRMRPERPGGTGVTLVQACEVCSDDPFRHGEGTLRDGEGAGAAHASAYDEALLTHWPCPEVRALALPFADDPAYRPHWRPWRLDPPPPLSAERRRELWRAGFQVLSQRPLTGLLPPSVLWQRYIAAGATEPTRTVRTDRADHDEAVTAAWWQLAAELELPDGLGEFALETELGWTRVRRVVGAPGTGFGAPGFGPVDGTGSAPGRAATGIPGVLGRGGTLTVLAVSLDGERLLAATDEHDGTWLVTHRELGAWHERWAERLGALPAEEAAASWAAWGRLKAPAFEPLRSAWRAGLAANPAATPAVLARLHRPGPADGPGAENRPGATNEPGVTNEPGATNRPYSPTRATDPADATGPTGPVTATAPPPDPCLPYQVLEHLSEAEVERLSRTARPELRARALYDPRLSAASVARLTEDPHPQLRQQAASDFRVPAPQLARLLRDRETARAAAQNPALPEREMHALLDRTEDPRSTAAAHRVVAPRSPHPTPAHLPRRAQQTAFRPPARHQLP